jgi:hypothetical protein
MMLMIVSKKMVLLKNVDAIRVSQMVPVTVMEMLKIVPAIAAVMQLLTNAMYVVEMDLHVLVKQAM